MSMLHDLATETVKEPFFDRPQGAEPAGLAISDGTRVVLSYQGKPLLAQVTAVERLGTAFVARVLRYQAPDAGDSDLGQGDHIRFRLKDVHGTE